MNLETKEQVIELFANRLKEEISKELHGAEAYANGITKDMLDTIDRVKGELIK